MIEQAQVAADILKEMKELAAKIHLLVNGMPPEELLGYILSEDNSLTISVLDYMNESSISEN
ncbi:hypothetical protein ACFFUO_07075 [Vibrio artabrorum]|uniref:Uncharacterized protein n=2 Tax=Vibrio TaxID=662 RepID=A0A1C3JKV0_9VIBR|nr:MULTISPECIES: hypothetical protein [Vibrio]MDN3702301.1 hypothetical protein [Vibrio artabrorum]SBT15707.1 hypothetical protein VCE7224_04512 [Vibrio celticus]